MQIEGTVIGVSEKEFVGKKQYPKRSFLIEFMQGDYSKKLEIELFGQNTVDLVTGDDLGHTVKCHLNVWSNEHNGKFYTQVQAWKVEKAQKSPPRPGNKYY